MATDFPLALPHMPDGYVNGAMLDGLITEPLNDLAARLGDDDGWVTTGMLGTTASGATSGSNRCTILAQGMLQLLPRLAAIAGSYTLGFDVDTNSEGDVINTPVIKLPAAFTPSSVPVALSAVSINSAAAGPMITYYIDGNGFLGIAATTAGAQLTQGRQLTFFGLYVL